MDKIKAAVILDEFSYQCLKYEWDLITLGPLNWREELEKNDIDLLLVESAWEGNCGSWRYMIGDLQKKEDKTIAALTGWCKEHGIPTVFWNKEDPINFNIFIEAAKHFDYVFTTDSDCIPRYIETIKHNRVYVLPFAAQPRLHNPIDRNREWLGKVAFAGTWYEKRHQDRKNDMELLLKPALDYGLHIYDRMFNYTRSDYYKFPEVYRKNIKGSLDYEEMIKAYKKYDIFLNVNSVQKSPTMFSRRVFELLACGTNVISGYSEGINNMFRDIVRISNSEADTTKHLEILQSNKELRERLSLKGQRAVFNQHTYANRLDYILKILQLKHEEEKLPGVSIVTSTNRPNNINMVFANYERQNYKNKELIVVLNKDDMDLKAWKKRAKKYENVRIYQLEESKTLGECINFGIDQMSNDYFSKFDDDNYYGPDFIGDLMNSFKYTDAGVVGKCTYFAYLEGCRALTLRFPENENRYVSFLSGSAMIVKKEIFDDIRFIEKSVGEDTKFLKDCLEKGIKLYSADRFNYVCIRHGSVEDHTWKIEDEEYLRKCQVIGYTDDYITHATV